VNLSWTDHSANEAGFRIDRSANGITFAKVATVGANITTYSDSGLATSKKYFYRVSAFNSGGNSANSNTATVALVVPSAPTNLTPDVEKHGHVTLKWKDNADNETAFQVERSTNGTVFVVMASTPANTTKYKDTNARRGQSYYYRVAAKNNVGLSSYSNVVTTP
jgi:fibronectin type 3 domain-containing protein